MPLVPFGQAVAGIDGGPKLNAISRRSSIFKFISFLSMLLPQLPGLVSILWFKPKVRSVSMASTLAPLTTIFTPPAGCFESTAMPDVWRTCYETRAETECYWSRPSECYPTGAVTRLRKFPPGSSARNATLNYAWSPGVIPSGFSTVRAYTDVSSPPSEVLGCWSCVLSYRTSAKHRQSLMF